MNGKIKTKFAALFAVALMITVCVVPMVGGSEDVEATTTETVTISGNVYAADGKTGLVGVKVYYGDTIGKYNYATTTSGGAFSFTDYKKIPVGNIVLKVDASDTDYEDYVFPVTTLGNVQSDKGNISIVAGTVPISGQMKLKGGSELKVEGISVSVGNTTVKTDDDGKFTLYVTPGNEYNVAASFANVTFSGKVIAVAEPKNQDNKVDITAASDMLVAEVSLPTGTLSAAASASGTAAASFGTPTFITSIDSTTDEDVYTMYASVSYNTGTTVNVDATMSYGYGIENVTVEDIVVANTTSGDITGKAFAASIKTGKISVGDVPVEAEVVLSSTATAGDEKDEEIEAFVKDGTFFVGTIYEYDNDDSTKDKKISNFEITAEYDGYIFNKLTKSDDFKALNVVEITVNVSNAPEKSQFVVDADKAVVNKNGYVASDNTGFKFFVPIGTEVTITAPANFAPASEKIVKAYGDTTISFTYNAEVVYKGQVLLNGIPVSLNAGDIVYSTDGGRTYENGDVGVWAQNVTEPYYTITEPRTTDASDIMVKIKVSDGKANGYLFEENKDDKGFTAAVGVTGTTIGAFNVKASKLTVTVKDNDLAIPGMEFEFQMFKVKKDANGKYHKEGDMVADLGKATTGSDGIAKTQAALPLEVSKDSSGYLIYAITDGESNFGNYGKKQFTIGSEGYVTPTAFNGQTVYGFYTADASAISGLEISYVEFKGTDLVGNGKATIIDNMYYIVLNGGNKVDLVVDDTKYDVDGTLKSIDVGPENIKLKVKADVKTVSVTLMDNEYSEFVKIQKPTKLEKGQVVVLSAEKTCYRLQNGGLQYEYTDAAVKYDFAGWYVNGKLLTEDCDTAITLSEDVVIVAQYDEAVKVIGSQDVPEAGLDTNVLILGIVVVVIALIAVVYSVISKRD